MMRAARQRPRSLSTGCGSCLGHMGAASNNLGAAAYNAPAPGAAVGGTSRPKEAGGCFRSHTKKSRHGSGMHAHFQRAALTNTPPEGHICVLPTLGLCWKQPPIAGDAVNRIGSAIDKALGS